jgi:hypothetical protein
MADAVRAAVKAWELSLFAKVDRYHTYSNTATAITYPLGVKDSEVRDTVKKLVSHPSIPSKIASFNLEIISPGIDAIIRSQKMKKKKRRRMG